MGSRVSLRLPPWQQSRISAVPLLRISPCCTRVPGVLPHLLHSACGAYTVTETLRDSDDSLFRFGPIEYSAPRTRCVNAVDDAWGSLHRASFPDPIFTAPRWPASAPTASAAAW